MDDHDARAARAYFVTAEALYEVTFSPGENEPLIAAGSGERIPAWRLSARRIAWEEAPSLQAEADDAHRGSGRSIKTTFALGDVRLPSATDDEEARTLAFARVYWANRVTPASTSAIPPSTAVGG